ncbi:hypothetical protein VTO42DRAFT_1833 [Malbranchea cinnamomea]
MEADFNKLKHVNEDSTYKKGDIHEPWPQLLGHVGRTAAILYSRPRSLHHCALVSWVLTSLDKDLHRPAKVTSSGNSFPAVLLDGSSAGDKFRERPTRSHPIQPHRYTCYRPKCWRSSRSPASWPGRNQRWIH